MLFRAATAAACVLAWSAVAAAADQSLSPFAMLAGPGDTPVEVEADTMVYDYDAQVLRLEGHVVARRSGGIVRAGSGVLDRAHNQLILRGGVLGVQGRQVFLADEAFVDLAARTAEFRGGPANTLTTTERKTEIQDGKAVEKLVTKTVATADLAVLYLKEKPADPNNPKAGKNSLILHGHAVRQGSAGHYFARDVQLTPCDCAGEPDYQLLADEAELEGDRAHLHGVTLEIGHLPLPLFPLSLPLTNRQWGLLAPQLSFIPTGFFGYAQPIFFPAGDSNDFTVTPGVFTGGRNSNPPDSSPIGSRNIKGPRLGLEWRYAPVQGTTGSVGLDMLYDLDRHESPAVPPPTQFPDEPGTSPGRGFGGVRGVAHLLHRTEGEQGTIAVQGTLATDAMVVSDAEPASLDRLLDYLRTDAGAWRARGATTLGIDTTYLQDIRIPNAADPDRRLFGAERRATFQRVPSLFGQLAPVQEGPVTFSFEASASQFATFAGPDQQERETGFGPTDLGANPNLPILGTNVARASGARGDFAPRFAWVAPGSLPVGLRLDAGGRVDGYLIYSNEDRNYTRAYADAGALVSVPLERKFGSTLHRIEPSFEIRGITGSLQSGGPPIGDPADAGGATYSANIAAAEQGVPPALATPTANAIIGVPSARRPYDEIDGAAPSTGAIESVFSLNNSLWRRQGKSAARWLRLDLQQDALFWARGGSARLGEVSAIAAVQGPFASFSATFRYDWHLRAISAIIGNVSLHDARTDEIHASTLLLRGSASERLRAGIDELFAAALLNAPTGGLAGPAGVGAGVPIVGGLRIAYDYTRNLSPEAPLPAGFPDTNHAATISYETACHCAAVSLSAAIPIRDGKLLSGPVIHFTLDLKSLGSFGTF
jgi:hypothetical protein